MHLLNALPQRLDPGATPTFAGLISASLTAPASTNLTLAGGAGNSSVILTPAGTGGVGIGTTTPASFVELKAAAGTLHQRFTDITTGAIGFIGGANGILSGAAANTMAVRSENGLFLSGAGNTNAHLVLNSSSQVLIGTTDSTGLTGAGGLKIASTTAGSSGAGALVVQGGISAGNTGSAASYFGGNLIVAQDKFSNFDGSGAARMGMQAVSVAPYSVRMLGSADAVNTRDFSFGYYTGDNAANAWNQKAAINSYTGAATFAGAVAIGNTVNTVSPTSLNRTVTMVIGGVTYYLAAKTTND